MIGPGVLLVIAALLWGAREWRRRREAVRIADSILRQDCRELLRLLTKGTDFKAVMEWYGEPALILAVKADGKASFPAEAAELLISHGADVDEQGGEWKTALMHAAARGDLSLCALLLSHGADAAARDMSLNTAACCAQLAGHARVASLLRKAGG